MYKGCSESNALLFYYVGLHHLRWMLDVDYKHDIHAGSHSLLVKMHS